LRQKLYNTDHHPLSMSLHYLRKSGVQICTCMNRGIHMTLTCKTVDGKASG